MSETSVAPLRRAPEAAPAGAPGGRGVPARLRASRSGWVWGLLGLVVLAFVAWPVIALEIHAFSGGSRGIADALHVPRVWTVLGNTVVLGVGSVIISLVLGTAVAWCAQRVGRRGRGLVLSLPMMPLVIPGVAIVIGWMFWLSPSVGYLNTALRKLPFFADDTSGPIDVYSTTWIVLVTGFALTSFVYLFVNTALRSLGSSFDEAAAVSGASEWRTFWTVTLPLLRPALTYATGIVLLLGMGQFTAPLILGTPKSINVLTTEMFRVTQQYPINFGEGAALGIPLILVGVLVVVGQRRLIRDETRFVVATGRSATATRRTHWWATAIVIVYGIVSTGFPLVALAYVAFSPFWSGTFSTSRLTTANFRTIFKDPLLTNAIVHSLVYSLVAVLVVIPLGLLCARALSGRGSVPRAVRWLFDLGATIPLMVPPTLLAFGLLFAYSQPPVVLYGTNAIMIVTYVTLMIPHATRLQLSSLLALGGTYWDAAKTSGAGPLRSLWTITLPLMRPAMGAAAATILVLLAQEFSASLLVRSGQTQVMGSVLYDSFSTGIYPQVAALALLMTAITAVGVLLARLLGGENRSG